MSALLLAAAVAALSAGAAPAPIDLLVTERTAAALDLRVGDAVEVAVTSDGPWVRARVAGVLRVVDHPAEIARRELRVRLHLPALESLLGRHDAIDRVVIRAPDARALAEDLNAAGVGYTAYVARDLAARASETLQVVERFQRAIGIVTVAASAIFLLTIMSLKGHAMRREVALLRLVGVSRRTVVWTFLLVAVAVALAGSALGIALALGGSWLINTYYRGLFQTAMTFSQITPEIVGLAVALALPLGVLAGGVVVLRILRRPPLEQAGR